MTPYRVYIHLEALNLLPTRGRYRHAIMSFIEELAASPFTMGDYIDREETLRERQVKIIGPYAITFWADHPVRIVMVVSVRFADF